MRFISLTVVASVMGSTVENFVINPFGMFPNGKSSDTVTRTEEESAVDVAMNYQEELLGFFSIADNIEKPASNAYGKFYLEVSGKSADSVAYGFESPVDKNLKDGPTTPAPAVWVHPIFGTTEEEIKAEHLFWMEREGLIGSPIKQAAPSGNIRRIDTGHYSM